MNYNRGKQIGGAIIAIFIFFIPVLLPLYYTHLATETLFYMLFAIGLNLLLGYGGMLAFGYGAFFGVGAYCVALIFNYAPEIHLILALIIAAAAGFVIALIIGALSVRLKGTYFALITFAFQMFLFAVAMKSYSVTGGDDGMTAIRPPFKIPFLGTISLVEISNLYYFTLLIVVIAVLIAYLFLKTPLGNTVVTVRENETRASFLGYNVYLSKVALVAFSGLLAGLAGGLFALFNEFVATTCIDVNISMTVVIMCIIGGKNHFLGPALGAAFYTIVQNWLSGITNHWWIFLGALYVAIVLYLPGGLMSLSEPATVRKLLRFKDQE